ncbi:MAG: hypothetical protein ACE5OZ_03255 [Candidatus Heimdallarchaeota archaeon]
MRLLAGYSDSFSLGVFGAIMLLTASISSFFLIGTDQVAWKFSTEVDGKEVSSTSGGFDFTGNSAIPNLSDPAHTIPADVGWEISKLKWTVFGLPGAFMVACLLVCGGLLLFAGSGALSKSINRKHLFVSSSALASILLLVIIGLLFLGNSNDPEKLGPNIFEKSERRIHIDDPQVGTGEGYDAVFTTEPGLGLFLLTLTTLNAFLGTFFLWKNDFNS